ncbi:hypothetical protein SAMN04515647_1917 [Cohaesibacter sp. ES.047]|uniref:hypothetical protein n=1 Tax=Cohaesibacter sp. ES.047 TaxID=1798205 RepID=UPI000BB8ED67|nr:hypothetical protein [Cohaesibacter sp. ES.047]SNY91689.1 hypothetical protein SAMN04515647_1917 [Cohaesibacter sp. ES.047]
MNKQDSTQLDTDARELAKLGHSLSTALFEGNLDQCLAIIVDHGNRHGYQFSDGSRHLLEQSTMTTGQS